MPRRNFRAAVAALALLALSGTAVQAGAASRGIAPAVSWMRIFAGIVPQTLRGWLGETPATAGRGRPMPRKCSIGIDPNGKPCP